MTASQNDDMSVLCSAIKASSERALEVVFRRLRQPLLRYAASIVRSAAAADDIVQDVFSDLWDMRRELDTSRSLEALLYRMCRNRAYTVRRNASTRERKHDEIRITSNASLTPNMAAALDSTELDGRLRVWIDELPERQREALLLCRLQDLSHREVADVMGVSPRTVNNHIIRALDTLKARIRTLEPNLLPE